MDLFQIKIFGRPKKIVSVVYSVEPNIEKSHFVTVEDYHTFLDQPGINPWWLNEVLEIQKNDLTLARIYALKEIENEIRKSSRPISVGFEWEAAEYKYDGFVSNVMALAGFD